MLRVQSFSNHGFGSSLYCEEPAKQPLIVTVSAHSFQVPKHRRLRYSPPATTRKSQRNASRQLGNIAARCLVCFRIDSRSASSQDPKLSSLGRSLLWSSCALSVVSCLRPKLRKCTHKLITGRGSRRKAMQPGRALRAVIQGCDNRSVAIGSIFAKRTTIGCKAVSYISLYIVCAMAAERQSDTFAATHDSIANNDI